MCSRLNQKIIIYGDEGLNDINKMDIEHYSCDLKLYSVFDVCIKT